ncbi:MAG: hypothetical protein K0S00_1080 [Xanthobacteraceae bacterium]|jgi:hypothetical protein|nr:hypothetical protein [Xanthobacteraceae bacterium]
MAGPSPAMTMHCLFSLTRTNRQRSPLDFPSSIPYPSRNGLQFTEALPPREGS